MQRLLVVAFADAEAIHHAGRHLGSECLQVPVPYLLFLDQIIRIRPLEPLEALSDGLVNPFRCASC